MSLATLLLAFLPAIVGPKLEPEKSDRERELEAERDALRAELERACVERDSWRRRYEDAREMLARVGGERIDARLERERQAAGYQQAMAAAQYQQQQLAAYLPNQPTQAQLQMQAMMNAQNAYARPFGSGELVDCTGGGRSRYLAGSLGLLGGA